MSAFVAIIRPGCASLLQDFIERKPYTTGVGELDKLLIEGSSRMIYQELIMKYLIWLGIPETGSYDIIKKIAKKKFKEDELAELKEKLLAGWISKVGTENGFIETWTVVEQAAHYSFNASHSLSYAYDSLYGAYLKSHYPLEYYTTALNYYGDDSERTLKLTTELQHFGIQLKPIKFRHSMGKYAMSKEDNSIYKGIQSIKNMNAKIADEIYTLRSNRYKSFCELLFDISEKTSINSLQLKILIELGFFSEFGDINLLLSQYEAFDKFNGRKQFKKSELAALGVSVESLKRFAEKETEKMLSGIDTKNFLIELCNGLSAPKRKIVDIVKSQISYLGYVEISGDGYNRIAAVLDVDAKYSPKLKMYSLKNGTNVDCKIDKRTFNKCKLVPGDLIMIQGQEKKPKSRRTENGWEPIPGTFEFWITKYKKLENI